MEKALPLTIQNYKVLVRCLTYNHSKYIENALNGFANQQVNFPFVCLVIDDASTDGEYDVIRQWIERECEASKAEIIDIPSATIILVSHRENITCTFAFYMLKKNLHGTGKKKNLIDPWREKCEYEALCEGDDYWIDPLKLQKQVDFLDSNKEYSLVITNGYCDNNKTGSTYVINPLGKNVLSKSISIEEMLIEKNMLIPTASMCFRVSLLATIPSFFEIAPVGDKPLRTWLALNGNVYYMHDKMLIYRMFAGDSFGNRLKNKEFARRIYDGMCCYYNNLDEYTKFKYHRIISYLISKEEYMYYDRIHDYYSIIKCKFFRNLSIYMKLNSIIKFILRFK